MEAAPVQAADLKQRMPLIVLGTLLPVNVAVALGFCYERWYPNIFDGRHKGEKYFLIAYLVSTIILIGLARFQRRRLPLLLNFNLAQFGIIILILAGETAFTIFPHLLPRSVIAFAPTLDPSAGRLQREVLEYLPDAPWIKFRPNVEVTSLGERGDDFVRAWQTDKRGFKNLPKVASLRRVVAIATGDSFVEAMGVETDKTWASLVSKDGLAVYNLGVQGYAPQQVVGALRQYAGLFDADFIIFGYTPGFEARALAYKGEFKASEKRFVGAIGNIQNYMEERRIRGKAGLLRINALLDFFESSFYVWRQSRGDVEPIPSDHRIDPALARFWETVASSKRRRFDPNKEEWALTEQAISDAKAIADKSNAALVVLVFYHRQSVYYQRMLGLPIPADHYELETARAVRELCDRLGVPVIDSFERLASYVNRLDAPIDPDKLPYFKVDGHMNPIGQKLVADLVLDFLRKQLTSRQHLAAAP